MLPILTCSSMFAMNEAPHCNFILFADIVMRCIIAPCLCFLNEDILFCKTLLLFFLNAVVGYHAFLNPTCRWMKNRTRKLFAPYWCFWSEAVLSCKNRRWNCCFLDYAPGISEEAPARASSTPNPELDEGSDEGAEPANAVVFKCQHDTFSPNCLPLPVNVPVMLPLGTIFAFFQADLCPQVNLQQLGLRQEFPKCRMDWQFC